jgi:hypothetical protein
MILLEGSLFCKLGISEHLIVHMAIGTRLEEVRTLLLKDVQIFPKIRA